MNKKFIQLLKEAGVKIVNDKKQFTQKEALKFFNLKHKDDVIYSDRVKPGIGVWINGMTSDAVLAKETPEEMLGEYAYKLE